MAKSSKHMRSKTKKNNHSRKHKHTKNCKVCYQKGGSCGCGGNIFSGGRKSKRRMRGGMMPPALVGQAWSSNVSNWPGVQGIPGETNYLSMNQYPVDPQRQVIQERDGDLFGYKGGRRKRRMRSKGGGLIPQDLVNVGRNFTHTLGSAYNTFNGYPTTVSPLPYKDQLPNTLNSFQLRNTY